MCSQKNKLMFSINIEKKRTWLLRVLLLFASSVAHRVLRDQRLEDERVLESHCKLFNALLQPGHKGQLVLMIITVL
jgi:hypothetical protein